MGAKVSWNKTKKQKTDPQYIEWIHSTQKCFVCGRSNVEGHHYKVKGQVTKKAGLILPLCPEHHRGSRFSIHMTPAKFYETYDKINVEEYVEKLYEKYLSEI